MCGIGYSYQHNEAKVQCKSKKNKKDYVQPDRCDKKKIVCKRRTTTELTVINIKGEKNHKLAVDGDLSALPHPTDQHGAVVNLECFVIVTTQVTRSFG